MSFNEDNYRICQREITTLMALYHLSYLRRLSEAFNGDLDMPLILGEVALRNIGLLATKRGFSKKNFDQLVVNSRKEGKLLPCSAMSASLATGLPRETVRRKLNKLAKNGFLEKLPDSTFVITEKPLAYYSEIFDRPLLADFLETSVKISTLLTPQGFRTRAAYSPTA